MRAILNKLIKLMLVIILLFLSYIIKKNKNIYVFSSIYGKEYSGNSRFLYEYIKENRKDIEVYFITKSKDLINKNPDFIYYNSVKGIYIILKSKYIFITHYISDIFDFSFLLGRFNIINLWHGEPLKKIEFSSNLVLSRIKPIYKYLTLNNYKKKLQNVNMLFGIN